MIPYAMFGLGVPELLIILAVVLLLFGGSRLAGLGKSTGRALKEFKEETKGLKGDPNAPDELGGSTAQTPTNQPTQSNAVQSSPTQSNPVHDPTPNDVRKDI